MSALVLSQNLTLSSEIELQVEASMQEKWRSNFECVIRYLSEHPLLYFLAFDWLTNLNGRGIWDETSKGQSASQRNNENFVLLWSLHAERKKKLGLCRVNENFAIIVENLSPRERTDDTAILNYLTKGYPRTRMKVWYVKTTKLSWISGKSRTMNANIRSARYAYKIGFHKM